ncbi:mevalonate kinase [Clostridium sp. 19966]|uniref:mevalonate kinase n=1 Tax=Clostridium sp. 19966 TaxID=2768166 RepID=UPI0028DFA31F|nr:mevalonate kinase [Clostridium sp. 19966]MDT8719292.1 mevalonate kinase [Clostridium sp. 19966]
MRTVSTKKAIGEAHSKLILVGEHAVVYGKPAIAIPFPLKVKVITKELDGPIMLESNIYTGHIDKIPDKMKGLVLCIKEALNKLNKPFYGLNILIDSSIPLGRGLGSSAAVAIASVKSLFSFFEHKLSNKDLFFLVQVAENYAHGISSGIDTAAELSGHPIWFQKGKEVLPIETKVPFYIAVGDTGRIGDTRTAVENVRKKYISHPMEVKYSLEEIEKAAASARNSLIESDFNHLGKLLNYTHERLVSLGVSDEGLDKLVQAAKDAGALGAKLTGGGLGGCMLALAKNLEHAETIAKELIKAGASKSWYFSSEENILYSP